jgi:hypothetical protein
LAIKNRIKIFYSNNLEDVEKQLNEFYAGPELQELVMVKFEINTYPAKVIVEYIPIITTTTTTTSSFSDSSIIVNN